MESRALPVVEYSVDSESRPLGGCAGLRWSVVPGPPSDPFRRETERGATRVAAEQRPVHTTMLALVQSLTHESRSEDEIVAMALDLVNTGRVVLTGSFRGCRLELPAEHQKLSK